MNIWKCVCPNQLAAEKTQRRAEHDGKLEGVRRKIASMIRAIEDGLYQPSMKARMADQESKAEAAEVIRSHIEKITLTPNGQGALDIHLHGDLARIREFCEAAEDKRARAVGGSKRERPGRGGPGRGLSVVAGACNHLYRTAMVWARPSRTAYAQQPGC